MKVIIADDHALFREGLKVAVGMIESSAIFFEAATRDELLILLAAHGDAKLLLLDLNMPGMKDVGDVGKIKKISGEIPLVVVSMHRDPEVIRAALSLGASGYIPKTHDVELIRNAIGMVLSGMTYIPEETLYSDTLSSPVSTLTKRQKGVLDLVLQGKSNQEISDQLYISVSTVKLHVGILMEKFAVKSRSHMIVECQKYFLNNAF